MIYSNTFIGIFHILCASDKIQWQNKFLVSLETNMIWCMQILHPWKSHAAIYNNAIKPLIHHELTFFKFCVLKSRSHNVVCRGVLMCSQVNAMSVVNTFVPDAQFSWGETSWRTTNRKTKLWKVWFQRKTCCVLMISFVCINNCGYQ